jgi:hypothetical protein
VVEAQDHLPNRQKSPGPRILRVDFGRAATQADDRFGSPGIGVVAGDIALSCHQIKIVGLDVVSASLLYRLLLIRQQLEFQRADNGFGYLVLQGKDVVQVAIVALGPNVIVARSVNQLCGDSYTAAGLAHAPFQNVPDSKFARHFGDVDILTFVHKGTIARHHG